MFTPFQISMAQEPYQVLIPGHFFVKRLKNDLAAGFDRRADKSFSLRETANVALFGVRCLTVHALVSNDLRVIVWSTPDILALETGTNDLAQLRPETIDSNIEELPRWLVDAFHVKIVAVCQVIPCGPSSGANFEVIEAVPL